ncbi:MAG: carbonic anhydrase [Methyloceanibacter sp.]|nr:carbonic anhydrase [Methyloceanibacter sp.]
MCELCNHSHPSRLSRRSAILGMGAAFSFAALPLVRVRADQAISLTPPPNAIHPDEALKRLMEGNARYAANAPNEKDFSAGRAERVGVQYPIAAVLGCSDSRVSPELAFDQHPGDIFVVRIAGNFVTEYGLASFEYAVKILGVPLIMVLGHTNCGAVGAAVKVVTERAELPGHLPELVKAIEPAVIAAHARHPSDLVAVATEENVKLNVGRLKQDHPIVSEAYAAKKINVVGGIYDLATGKISLL